MKHLCTILMIALALTLHGRSRTIVVADTTGYEGPTIGNGYLGAKIGRGGLPTEGLFAATAATDGSAAGVSTIVPLYSPISLTINGFTLAEGSAWQQRLVPDSGYVATTATLPGLDVSMRVMALRGMPHTLMALVSIKALRADSVRVVNTPLQSQAMQPAVTNRRVWCEDGGKHVQRMVSPFNDGRSTAVSTTIFEAPAPWLVVNGSTIKAYLRKGETTQFAVISNVVTSNDFRDPINESERMALYSGREGSDKLMADHTRRWMQLWDRDIVIDGDDWLQHVADVALYNLYSSLGDDTRMSIAPMGLTSQLYSGHIFWDADMWIHPVLARLQPRLARNIVDYRIDRLPQAIRRARAYGFGGAMYPWESDFYGEESTPTFALTGPLEHHITADVAIAAWNQYKAEGDNRAWLAEAYPMIKACADFWTHRATANADGSYSINNVAGADEYAIGVDDNAYTNGAAKRALEIASEAAHVLGYEADPQWDEVARNLRFARNKDGVILEHATYAGEKIKQADAALLAYPLGIITDPKEIRATLDFYDPHLDTEHGPAMAHALAAVNYARMGDGAKAYDTLVQGIRPYIVGPFYAIAETPSNGKTYFMTGGGAILQAILFGFMEPGASLPPHIRSITLR